MEELVISKTTYENEARTIYRNRTAIGHNKESYFHNLVKSGKRRYEQARFGNIVPCIDKTCLMKIYVEGVQITLTPGQIAIIDADKRKRAKCHNSFAKMLRHFGFKQHKELPNCYEQQQHGWWAEIVDHDNWSTVWITGTDLKNSSFPGGWNYGEPIEIEQELTRALDAKNK